MKIIYGILVLVAVLFGIATIFAGSRVLLGTNPGYVVFLPLLYYNSAMGIVYIVAGIIAWRSLNLGMYAAAGIFLLNLFVLIAIFYLYKNGSAIAVDSLRAMTLRTVVWLVLVIGFGWLNSKKKPDDVKSDA